MAVLWGRDATEYGHVVSAAPAAHVGLALTRGRHPKPYGWTDPNEDAAAAVVGPRATLLVVADGHSGVLASEIAVRAVLGELGHDPPPELGDDDLIGLFHRTGTAVLAGARASSDTLRRGSRTTLSIALVSGQRLCWAALGDSPVLVAEDGQGMELTAADEPVFVGAPLTLRRVGRLLQRGRGTLGRRAWVALTSDGFANYQLGPTPADSAAQVLAEAEDAAAAATALVDHACAAGAGDNVAAAVAAPVE